MAALHQRFKSSAPPLNVSQESIEQDARTPQSQSQELAVSSADESFVLFPSNSNDITTTSTFLAPKTTTITAATTTSASASSNTASGSFISADASFKESYQDITSTAIPAAQQEPSEPDQLLFEEWHHLSRSQLSNAGTKTLSPSRNAAQPPQTPISPKSYVTTSNTSETSPPPSSGGVFVPFHDGHGYFGPLDRYSINAQPSGDEYSSGHSESASNHSPKNNQSSSPTHPRRSLSTSTGDASLSGLSRVSSLQSPTLSNPVLDDDYDDENYSIQLDQQLQQRQKEFERQLHHRHRSLYEPESITYHSYYSRPDFASSTETFDPVISIGKKRRNRKSGHRDRSSKRSNTSTRTPTNVTKSSPRTRRLSEPTTYLQSNTTTTTTKSSSSQSLPRNNNNHGFLFDKILRHLIRADPELMDILMESESGTATPTQSSTQNKNNKNNRKNNTMLPTPPRTPFLERYAQELDPFSLPVVWRNFDQDFYYYGGNQSDEEEQDEEEQEDQEQEEMGNNNNNNSNNNNKSDLKNRSNSEPDLTRSYSISSVSQRILRSLYASFRHARDDLDDVQYFMTPQELANAVNTGNGHTASASDLDNNEEFQLSPKKRIRRASSLPTLGNQLQQQQHLLHTKPTSTWKKFWESFTPSSSRPPSIAENYTLAL